MKHPLTLPTKILLTVLVVLPMAQRAFAQETIALDEAQRVAQKLASTITSTSDQPFAIEVNTEKPVGLKGGDAGLIVLPDKRLTAELLAGAGKTITPVAQLWMYRVTLSNSGKSVDTGKVRMVTVSDGDKSRDVQLFLIGVTKSEQGALELVVYGKGNDPVARVPLSKATAAAQDFPIAISGQKTGDDSATLTLNLSGQYTADLAVVKAAD